ncbi:hypothetical protein ACGRSR_06680 [Vibrio owensii]|uniref:hypothetical protein n=1 Tax=Vibrio owensii TaxID=696485 RepID=UPI0037487180
MKKTVVESKIEAYDIDTVAKMNPVEYENYLEELIYIDHHDIVRSGIAGYPLAVECWQIDCIIRKLETLKSQKS